MRPITRRALRVLNSDRYDPVWLLQVTPAGGTEATALRLTNAGRSIAWNGYTWLPCDFSAPDLSDGLVTAGGGETGGGGATVSVGMSGAPDDPVAEVLARASLEGANVRVWVSDRSLLSNVRDALPWTRGLATGAILTPQQASFRIADVAQQLADVEVPRRACQRQCNYTFGGRACGVDVTTSPFTISTTVSAATIYRVDVPAAVLTTAGSPDDPDDFWAAGYLRAMGGQAAPAWSAILRVDAASDPTLVRVYLDDPLPVAPEVGDSVALVRGCRRTKEDCLERQGAFAPHGGFEEVPYGDLVLEARKVR